MTEREKKNKIDDKIQDLVSALNLRGIPTTGSCEGHIDHGSPAPWIKITTPDEPINARQDTEEYRRWKNKDREIRLKTVRLLNEFYKNHSISEDLRFVIEDANSGFWIHNGGDAYSRWRTFVNENVARIQSGKEKQELIDKEEQVRRSKMLHSYQKEIEPLTKFLKGGLR